MREYILRRLWLLIPTIIGVTMRVKPFDDVRARKAVGGFGMDRSVS